MSSLPPPSAPPSSLARPPPTDPNTGKYLVTIAVLGAAMGGLLAWRHFHADADIAPAPSASALVAAAQPTIDTPIDIPPPEIIPDAGVDTGSARPRTSSVTGNESCAQGACRGSITPEVSNALAFRAKTAHRCYDDALAQDSNLKGSVVINVRLSASGAVCSATVASNELSNPGVAACIANKFRQGARFPSPVGGCIDVNVPMRLLPGH